ncbi:MAG: radical SAM family heme chaperone HemW [Lachnospiraceae bacterium]|nr:radical SAM family heme chaperone HemW [Lachnospiraceae bacterium]
MKELSLYLHIPFCVRKCPYCDFLSAPADGETIGRYADALIEEVKQASCAYTDHDVVTVFLGGGTPSLLHGKKMQVIMDAIRANYRLRADAEISMEANPGTVTKESLAAYREAGINRLSIGLQSADEALLRTLGRIHTKEDFVTAWAWADEAGFRNRNIDLMEGIPGQSLDAFEQTLRFALSCNPTHISAYSLIVEEGTPFFAKYHDGRGLPDEETERAMYALTGQLLSANGYRRYEISNYAQDGFECLHNIGYWNGREYVGFGIGSSSYVNHTRWKNTSDLKTYMSCALREEVQHLTMQDEMAEFMFLGLRMMCGVSKEVFAARFSQKMDDVYGDVIKKHAAEGLLLDGDHVRLTEEGISVSNYVMADFLF